MHPLVVIGNILTVFILVCPLVYKDPYTFAKKYYVHLAIMSISLMIVRYTLVKVFPHVAVFHRPSSSCGPQKTKELYTGGMPSGHMASIALCCTLLSLTYPTIFVAIFGAFAIVTMAAFRYHIQCHNIPQIIAGTLIGGLWGKYIY